MSATSTVSLTKTKLAVASAVMFLAGGAAAFAAIGGLPALQKINFKTQLKPAPSKELLSAPKPFVKDATTGCGVGLVIAKNPALADKTRANPTGVVGDQQRAIASFTIQNCTSENVVLSDNIVLRDTYKDNIPATCASTYISNLVLKSKGVQLGSKLTMPANCVAFSTQTSPLTASLTIPKDSTITVDVIADLKAALDPAAVLLSFEGVRATGTASGNDYSQWVKNIPLQTVAIAGQNPTSPAAPYIVASCVAFNNCTPSGLFTVRGPNALVGEYQFKNQRFSPGESVVLNSVKFHLEGDLIASNLGDNKIAVKIKHWTSANPTVSGFTATGIVAGANNGLTGSVDVQLSPSWIYAVGENPDLMFEVDSSDDDFQLSPSQKKSIRVVVDQFTWSDQNTTRPIAITVPATTRADAHYFLGVSGAMRVTNLPVTPTTVSPGMTGVTLAKFEFNPGVVSSGENIILQGFTISRTGLGSNSDFQSITLYDNNGNPLDMKLVANTTIFSLRNQLSIPSNGSIVLTLKGDIATSATAGATHKFTIVSPNDVSDWGATSGNFITPTIVDNGSTITIGGTANLKVEALQHGPLPFSSFSVGQNDLSVFGFSLEAMNEPIKLTSLKLTATGKLYNTGDIKNIKLFYNNATTPFLTANSMLPLGTNGVYTFTWTSSGGNLLPNVLQPGRPAEVYVHVDIGNAGQANLGDDFTFKIDGANAIEAVGVNSGTIIGGSGLPIISRGPITIVPFYVDPIVHQPAAGTNTNQRLAPGSVLATLKLVNNGSAKITVRRLTFNDYGRHTGNTTRYSLKYSDQNNSNFTANTAIAVSDSLQDFFFPLPGNLGISIDANSYRYVTVALAEIGAIATGDTFQLEASTEYGMLLYDISETDLQYDGNGNGQITDNIVNLPMHWPPYTVPTNHRFGTITAAQ